MIRYLLTLIYSATSVIQALDTLENRLSAVCVENHTSNGNTPSENINCDQDNSQPRSSTPISISKEKLLNRK